MDHVIRELYRHEETVATCRAYLALLEPMSPDKRMHTVMRIGFLPDPLVASVVHRIRQIRQKELEAYDLFDPKPEPSHLSPEEEARARSYEKILPGLIEASLQRMKTSLEILDLRDGPEADAKAKPPSPCRGAERSNFMKGSARAPACSFRRPRRKPVSLREAVPVPVQVSPNPGFPRRGGRRTARARC